MAIIHDATMKPSKLELLSSWLPTRPWFGGAGDVKNVGAYRFDDPGGEVGLEAILVQAGDGPVLHVPLTYRGAPVAGAEARLVGTAEHSVLGTRWVYDGCGDPVWAAELAKTILDGGAQAEELVEVEGGGLVPREPTVWVRGSGTGGMEVVENAAVSCHDEGPVTVMRTGPLELVVIRVLGAEVPATGTLTGSWAGGEPVMLAGVRTV